MNTVITGIIGDLNEGVNTPSSIVSELRGGDHGHTSCSPKFVSLPLQGLHDRALTSSDWQCYVIARVSSANSVDTGNGTNISDRALELTTKVNFARHLSLRAILIEDLHKPGENNLIWGEDGLTNFAHALKRLCFRPNSTTKFQSFWLRMAVLSNTGQQESWSDWDTIRHMINHDPQVMIALDFTECAEIGASVGKASALRKSLSRWHGEPIKALILPTRSFLINQAGYPVLSPLMQELVSPFLGVKGVHVLLDGPPLARVGEQVESVTSMAPVVGRKRRVREEEEGKEEGKEGKEEGDTVLVRRYDPYVAYLKFLYQRAENQRVAASANENSNYGYDNVDKRSGEASYFSSLAAFRDVLQAPLQPLIDNLESETYETFERDLVKYERYEEALHRAMCRMITCKDWVADGVEVVVAGAGRGPLVDATLRAWKRVQKEKSFEGKLRIVVVEKNAHAMTGLRMRLSKEKGYPNIEDCSYTHHSHGARDVWDPDVVTLVHEDMRKWGEVRKHIKSSEGAHIVVSELLGSFGDNELSPECLEGVQEVLRAECGVSIPHRYTSHLAPVASSKLWMQARDLFEGKGLGTPFVVNMYSFTQLTESQPVFTFTHVSYSRDARHHEFPPPPHDYAGSISKGAGAGFIETKSLSFGEIAQDCIVHGFVGYFDAELYPADEESAAVVISTNPQNCTRQMMSWFPMYFPIEKPVTVRAGERVKSTMWRCSSKRRREVWYEWALVSPVVSKVHNDSGCCSSISFLDIDDV